MKRPRAHCLVGDVEGVGPALAGADLIGALARVVLRAERPRAVGVYTVADAVDMKAVRGRVAV